MKTTHLILLSSIVSVMLTACGGGGSSAPKQETPKEETPKQETPKEETTLGYDYSDFDLSVEGNKVTSLIRNNYKLMDGVLYKQSPQAIVGSAPSKDAFVTAYMADSKTLQSFKPKQTSNGTAVMLVDDYSDDGITFTPYNSEKNTDFNTVGKYKVKDLTNVYINNSKSQELMLMASKLPVNLAFPEGSKCRSTVSAKLETPNANEAVVFMFDETGKTAFDDLSGLRSEIALVSGVAIVPSSVVKGKAGGRYDVEGFKDTLGNTYSHILYEGYVYEALFASTAEEKSDFTSCSEYNQIASDFIIDTVKKYN